MAEWLRNGLQNRVPRFNSGRGLQPSLAQREEAAALKPEGRRRALIAASCGWPARINAGSCFQCGTGFVICGSDASRLFPGSSAVEQPAVNRLVAGSNPARGANVTNIHPSIPTRLRSGTMRRRHRASNSGNSLSRLSASKLRV